MYNVAQSQRQQQINAIGNAAFAVDTELWHMKISRLVSASGFQLQNEEKGPTYWKIVSCTED